MYSLETDFCFQLQSFLNLFKPFSRTQIQKLCSSTFPDISLRFILGPGKRLSSFFHFKDRIPMLVRSRMVYQYKYHCCRSVVLHQTRRQFRIRISEHMGVSPSNSKNLSTHSLSSILVHTHHTQHVISPNYFSIISSALYSSSLELVIRESLLISKFKSSLNENISLIPLSLF